MQMEVLVLINEAASLDDVQKHAAIIHKASPRLCVVSAGPAAIAMLAKLPEVIAVTETRFPVAISAELDQAEILFATAFAASNTKKQRKGENMAWDTPGFDPPDAPPENTSYKTRKLKPKSKHGGERNDPENKED